MKTRRTTQTKSTAKAGIKPAIEPVKKTESMSKGKEINSGTVKAKQTKKVKTPVNKQSGFKANKQVDPIGKTVDIAQDEYMESELEVGVYKNPIYATPVSEFNYSVRTSNCLASAGIDTLGDLVRYNPAQLMTVKGFGNKSLLEVQTHLKTLDLPIKPRILTPKFLITEEEAERLLARNNIPRPIPSNLLSVVHDKRIISRIVNVSDLEIPLDNVINLNANNFVNWREVSKQLSKQYDLAYKAELYQTDEGELTIDPSVDGENGEQIGFVMVTKEDIFNILGENNVRVSSVVLELIVVKVVSELKDFNIQLNEAYA